jgi:molecular chaperone DnaK
VRAEAYVPLLDAEFEIQVELGRTEAPPVAALRKTLAEVSDRAHALRTRVADLPVGEAVAALDRLYAEGVLEEAGRLLRAAEADPDAAWTCHSRLLDGQTILDDVESSLELPALMERVRKLRENVARKLQQSSTPADLADFQTADAAAEAALRARDKAVLRRQADALMEIGLRALRRTGRIEALIFDDLRRRIGRIPEKAKDPGILKLIARGRTDVDHRDHEDLAKVNAELRSHLPADAQGQPDWFSTVDER